MGRNVGPGLTLAGLAIVVVALAFPAVPAFPATAPGAPGPSGAVGSGVSMALVHPASVLIGRANPYPWLRLNASVSGSSVCAYGASDCPAGTGAARITLTASVSTNGTPPNWSSVQVLFLLETGVFDGVACSTTCAVLPGMSNGLPFFLQDAGPIATAISGAHPGTNVSFGLAQFLETCNSDDCDRSPYYSAVGTFANASRFGAEVNASLSLSNITDVDIVGDGYLQSSSIQAVYAGLNGSGIQWSNASHHVLVVIGSEAPQDPRYAENACTGLIYYYANCSFGPVDLPSCPYNASSASLGLPPCEGWVAAHNGNASDSVAAYAGGLGLCATSAGGECTVDVVDLNATPTDANSSGWRQSYSSLTLNRSAIANDTTNVLRAGCDLANATGGTWAGPSDFTCPQGTVGRLGADPLNSSTTNLSNPTLFSALAGIGFGAVPRPAAGQGIVSGPLISYVAPPGVSLAPTPGFSVSCATVSGAWTGCTSLPQVSRSNGTLTLGWNWSDGRTAPNALMNGDSFQATFSLVEDGPPGSNVTLDACGAPGCVPPPPGTGGSGLRVIPWDGASPVLITLPAVAVSTEALFPLNGSLAASPAAGEAPLSVTLSPVLTGGLAPFATVWTFGDGSPGLSAADSAPVSHTYPAPGVYEATIAVTDALGAHLAVGRLVTVYPTLTVSVSAPSIVNMFPTISTFSATAQGGVYPYNYTWDFGDGTSAFGSTVVHGYSAPGTYTGQLTAVDQLGVTAVDVFAVEVFTGPGTAPPPNPPTVTRAVAGYSPSATAGCGSGPVTARLTATVTGGMAPYAYAWTLGDGGTASGGPNVTHVYASFGTYPVMVRVTDAAGASANGSLTLQLVSPPCATRTAGGEPSLFLAILPYLLVDLFVAQVLVITLLRRRRRRRPPVRTPRAVI